MKKLKIFYNGKRLKDVYPHATAWQVFKFRVARFMYRGAQLTAAVSLLYAASFAGSYLNPRLVYAEPVVTTPPVLQRIAQCESHNSHFCTDALIAKHMCPKGMLGQVLVRGNKNKSVDVGLYQINADTWGAIATDNGFNIYTEEGNMQMAKWIYENRGTADWEASRKCWYK
jgi:hypothetical protein